MPQLVFEYVKAHKTEIEEYYDWPQNAERSEMLVTPTTILFARDGKVVILCNVPWDEENGIGIGIMPEYRNDLQDVFL